MSIRINFNDLQPGTDLTDQYAAKGVTFNQGAIFKDPFAPSGGNAVRFTSNIGAVEFPDYAIKGTFTAATHSHVGVSIATDLPNGGSARLTVFDSQGTELKTIFISIPRGNQYTLAEISSAPATIASFLLHSVSRDQQKIDSLVFDDTRRSVPEPVLLDLSGNVAQFGVMFPLAANDQSVSGLILQGSAANVRVFTLPSVMWEPVLVLNSTVSPSGESSLFPYSGPPTQIATRSGVSLPISPREALDTVVQSFQRPSRIPLSARVSLPFGMVAVMDAQPFRPGHGLNQPSTTVELIRPVFDLNPGKQPQLAGCDQLSLQRHPTSAVAVSVPQNLDTLSNSPSFPGSTTLLQMPLAPDGNGNPAAPTDIIKVSSPGSTLVSDSFRSTMKDMVPLTRIDISGYGESTFSDWRREPPGGVGISKVNFEVFTGRTARETIRMNSIMAPYAVKVVRTIDIKRLNSGVVLRQDSGWRPTTDGEYNYDQPALITHPGVVLRATQVTNIRDVTRQLVKFDCILVIEDLTSPTGERGVLARDQLGFVFEDPAALNPASYMSVLEQNNLGGVVDFIMDIGKSTQKMRVTSVTASTGSSSPGTKVAVMATWGSPVFSGEGQWSFTRQLKTDKSPTAVDSAKGVPLVRAGDHLNLASRTTPYIFRDPADLLADAPDTVYSLLHGAASYRVLFQKPELPFDQTVKSIVSQGVKLADSYALGNASGLFPELQKCLPVGGDLQKQALNILDGGHYSFDTGQVHLDGLPERLLKADSTFTSLVGTAATATTPAATMNLAINTAQQLSKLDLDNISMITKSGGTVKKEISTVVGSLKAEAAKLGELVDTQHLYGEALEQVRKVVSFLEKLKILPNFKVSMTNAWAMEISTSMTRKDLLDKLGVSDPVSRAAIEKIIEVFDLAMKARTSLTEFNLTLSIKVIIKIPTGFGPVALGVGGFDVAVGTAGTQLSLELGCGLGVDFSVGPFSASASYTQSQTIIVSEDVWGVAMTAVVRAHVDLVIASANLYLEAKFLLVGGKCTEHDHPQDGSPPHTQDTIWAYVQVRIALEVSIFLVLDVKVDEETQWENQLNHGPCKLDFMREIGH